MIPWFMYPITVPFGNPNYDIALGGSHDLDVGTPPNTPVTALLSGIVSNISAPSWGKQVCLALDLPFNNIPYMAYLHLAAVNPLLEVGSHIGVGEVIGWSGGCTAAAQYAGTSNLTGANFLNLPSQSSQPQTGIALMWGPEYGLGAGWKTFPPIDMTLDPTTIILKARAKYMQSQVSAMEQQMLDIWNMFMEGIGEKPVPYTTGIAASWKFHYIHLNAGSPLGPEKKSVDWQGNSIQIQYFTGGLRCEWNNATGTPRWYDIHNSQIA